MTPDEARRFLSCQGWLAQVPADFRDALLAGGQLRMFGPDEIVSLAGDTDVGMWGIVSGQLAFVSALNGADAPVTQLLHPGDWAGAAPLLGRPRMASCTARIESCILFLPMTHLRQVQKRPDFFEHLAQLMLDHFYRATMIAGDLVQKSGARRVAGMLLNEAGCRRTGAPRGPLHLTQAEVGDMSCLSRHPTAHILAGFGANGWIASGYRRIDILDAAALRRLADGD